MTDADIDRFGRVFRDLWATLGYKAPPDEIDGKLRVYWQALRGVPFEQVQRGADLVIATEAKMPKPSVWLEYARRPEPSAPLPPMTPGEARDYLEAERLCWEGEACECQTCREAGCSASGLRVRFVPTEAETRRAHPRTGQPVLVGQWVHGWALARWYLARDAARDAWRLTGGPRRMTP